MHPIFLTFDSAADYCKRHGFSATHVYRVAIENGNRSIWQIAENEATRI